MREKLKVFYQTKMFVYSFSFIFLIFTAIFVINACSESVNSIENRKEYKNPFKKYGLLHNELIKEISKEFTVNELNKYEVAQKAVRLIEKKGLFKNNTKNILIEDTLINGIVDCFNNDPNTFINNLYSKGLINEEIKVKLCNYAIEASKNLEFDYQMNKIIELEWDIVDDSELTVESKDALLCFTAVAKESASYWYQNAPLDSKRPWSWWVAFGADAAAFTIGFIGGGPAVACPLSVGISLSASMKE